MAKHCFQVNASFPAFSLFQWLSWPMGLIYSETLCGLTGLRPTSKLFASMLYIINK